MEPQRTFGCPAGAVRLVGLRDPSRRWVRAVSSFKALAAYVAFLLEHSPGRRLRPTVYRVDAAKAIQAFYAVTEAKTFHDKWWLLAADGLKLDKSAPTATSDPRRGDAAPFTNTRPPS